MAKVRSHASSSIASTVPPVEAPAAVKRTSMRPHRLITRSTPVRALALLLTSAVMVIDEPPLALISEATFFRPPSFWSTSASLAPSAANSFAEAAPMPEAAPVTMATRSLSFMAATLARQGNVGRPRALAFLHATSQGDRESCQGTGPENRRRQPADDPTGSLRQR